MVYLTAGDVSALASKPEDHRLFYGSHSAQFGDLRLPSGSGPFPVAIIVHGGCWLSKYASNRNTAALADTLRRFGIATWNIEYRRVDQEGGGWPGTFLDVAQASDFLKTIAEAYSLDLTRVIAMGHSAGGHLALWLAGRSRIQSDSVLFADHPLPLCGVISMGGVPDLKIFRKQAKAFSGQDVVNDLTAGRYGETSPFELLPLGVPQILIYGVDDKVVPVELAHAYVLAAWQAGDSVELVMVPNAAHHEYNAPGSSTWEAVKSAFLSLLRLADIVD